VMASPTDGSSPSFWSGLTLAFPSAQFPFLPYPVPLIHRPFPHCILSFHHSLSSRPCLYLWNQARECE